MTKLKLGPIAEDKPVKMTVALSATLARDLELYAKVLARESGQSPVHSKRLIVPMLDRFIATDRGVAKLRRKPEQPPSAPLSKEQSGIS